MAFDEDIFNQIQNANRNNKGYIKVGLTTSANHYALFEQTGLDSARIRVTTPKEELTNEWRIVDLQ